jgi:outer membrane protein with beta-barrel domain
MRNLYILLFLLFLVDQVQAQSNLYYFQEAKTWEYGPRIGFTTSMINSKGDPNIQRGIKMGLVGGVFVRYQLADQWALQTDISYSTRGNKNDILNIENSYIDFSIVPVRNWNYRMFKGDHTFDFFLGPGISFLTTSEDKSGNISDLESLVSSTEFNVVIGGSLPFGPFLLTATNRLGMSNLLGTPLPGSNWYSFVTEWSVAYRFK